MIHHKIAFGYLIPATLLGLSFSEALYAAEYVPEFKAGMESFRWKEFSEGEQILKESGNRFTFSFALDKSMHTKQGSIYSVELKLYQGTVDYDGFLQDFNTGQRIPHQTETDYFGYTITGDIGTRKPVGSGDVSWDIVFGANMDTWTRDLQGIGGYQEEYFILNVHAATGPSWHKGNWRGRLAAGIKLPFYTNESVGDFELEPEGQTSPFIKFYNRVPLAENTSLVIDAYYDSYRFNKSTFVPGTVNGLYNLYHQPDSDQDVMGLQIGISGKF